MNEDDNYQRDGRDEREATSSHTHTLTHKTAIIGANTNYISIKIFWSTANLAWLPSEPYLEDYTGGPEYRQSPDE